MHLLSVSRIFLTALAFAALNSYAGIGHLRVNHIVNPLGVDDPSPRMQWRFDNLTQNGGRIIVGTDSLAVASGRGDMWTAPLPTDGKNTLAYAGKKLEPNTAYYWCVESGAEKSPVAKFSTGLMGKWAGNWISDHHNREFRPAPLFRKSLTLNKPVKKATAYIAAGGLFRFSVNGERIGDQVMTPVYTRFDRRNPYLTFDVTKALQPGENVLGVLLGNGWYNHQAKAVWNFDNAPWRNRPAFCLDLVVEYADGTRETIGTDLTWRTSAETPLIYNNIYTGEHYDFNRVDRNWDKPGYDDRKWHGVRLRSVPSRTVSSQQMQPIRHIREYNARSITRINDTTYVFDFGKNMSGITVLDIQGPKGAVVKVAHGERLHPNGTLNPSNIDVYYRGDRVAEPFQTDIYILDGKRDTYTPEFSYKGFRYAQITTSEPMVFDASSLKAREVHSDVASRGSIRSSNKLLEGIMDITRNAYISNLMGYPTDCPQREKNGWTGDGHLAIETALYNYDGITIYEKWLADHRDEQQPNGVLPDIIPTGGWGYGTDNGLDWTSTIAVIPWNLYLFYGDDRALRDSYDNIKRYVDYVDHNSPSHLSAWGRGDWVPVSTGSNKELTSSVYFFVDATILAKAAKLFGKEDDYKHYSQLADDIKKAINNKFLDREKGIYASGSQTEMSMPLMWGIVTDDMIAAVSANLAKKVEQAGFHIDTGILGAKALLNALSENGYVDAAYKVAVQDTYPSWGCWYVNGATSLLENWDLNATRDISDNHIMFGEIGAWPYKGLAGIFPDENNPGFRHIILKPNFPAGLADFSATHESPYGEITSGWTTKKGKITYTVTIPSNTTATLTLPDCIRDAKTVELQSGTHTFTLKRARK